MENPRTYGEALANGWKNGEVRYQRGYVSRRSKVEELPVEVAGGNRKGRLYVLMPNWGSTIYCYRQYLYK